MSAERPVHVVVIGGSEGLRGNDRVDEHGLVDGKCAKHGGDPASTMATMMIAFVVRLFGSPCWSVLFIVVSSMCKASRAHDTSGPILGTS
jgi:hypothetical protein